MSYKRIVLISFTCIFIFFSCKKEYPINEVKLSNWDPIVAMPIAVFNLSIFDIIDIENRMLNSAQQEFISENDLGFDFEKYQELDSLQIPVIIEAEDVEFWYETPIGIESFPNFEQAKEVEFRIRSVNNFPFNLILQVYFLDENYNTIDSLFLGRNNVRRAGQVRLVNENNELYYISVSNKIEILDIPYQGKDLEGIKQATRLIYRLKGLNPGITDSVLLDANTSFNLKIAVRVNDFNTTIDKNN